MSCYFLLQSYFSLLECITVTAHPLSTIWSISLLIQIAVSGGQSLAFKLCVVFHILDYEYAVLE